MWFHSTNILLSLSVMLILVAGISIFPIRLKIRQKAMAKLANEFGLKFTTQSPKFSDFYLSFLKLYLRPDWNVNNIEGIINDHSVYIYDNLFSGQKIIFPMNWEKWHTVIKIDEQYIKGKEEKYKSFKLGDSLLTPISSLREELKNLK